MSTVRASVGLLALVTLLAVVAPAQEKKEAKLRGFLPANWKALALTDDQKQAVYRKQAEYAAKIEELEAKIKDLRKEKDAELEKILTPAQKDRLREIKAGKTGEKADAAKPEKKPGTN
jgi:TolA-binding protein